ncbi:hypothetical protein HanXRQr2_Chr09g0407091 [Helianthus annuus]|nr:hypothetical protein HanXRQr2_Chr09g0407091 [Helianthus annuus]KAJ0894791.1 hypothetical protein HanPSC8_Chr09g0392971 [Helianthus annuus]
MKRVKRSKYGKKSEAWMQGEYQEYPDEDQATKRTEHMKKKLPHVASLLFLNDESNYILLYHFHVVKV